MATYYVRKTGLDANAGTSAGAAWLTIDKAANTVAAGDTVYVGAGTYRELVTMDTSGTSVNQISFIADVDGSQTGDAGLVVVSAFTESAGSTAPRAQCWDLNAKDFITIQGFVMQGGSTAALAGVTGSTTCYEGVIVADCVLLGGPAEQDRAVSIEYGDAATPTNQGLTFQRCSFWSPDDCIYLNFASQTDVLDAKVVIENCVAINTTGASAVIYLNGLSGTGAAGGFNISNCYLSGGIIGVYSDADLDATNPTVVRNCHIESGTCLQRTGSNDGGIDSDFNTLIGDISNVTLGPNDIQENVAPPLLGGMADLPLWRFWGWSPYRPWEPMENGDDWTHLVAHGDTTAAPATDFYGESRPMNRGVGVRQAYYYFDASDSGPTDPGASWTNEANIYDDPGKISKVTSSNNYGSTTTQGSNSADYITAVGTNAPTTAPAGSSDSDIVDVYVTVAAGSDAVNLPDLDYEVRHSSETLGSPAANNINFDPEWISINVSQNTWTFGFVALTAPTGGWTWAKIAALELRIWKADADTDELRIYGGFIRVDYNATTEDDIGAVESRARPQKEVSTTRTGTASFRFEGAGFHDVLVPVAATSTTISVYGRYDSNHSGSLPQLKVLDIPGVADQTDTMVAAANTWEELTATFTPTAAGIARVRLFCRDTSGTGKVFFDDLTVT